MYSKPKATTACTHTHTQRLRNLLFFTKGKVRRNRNLFIWKIIILTEIYVFENTFVSPKSGTSWNLSSYFTDREKYYLDG